MIVYDSAGRRLGSLGSSGDANRIGAYVDIPHTNLVNVIGTIDGRNIENTSGRVIGQMRGVEGYHIRRVAEIHFFFVPVFTSTSSANNNQTIIQNAATQAANAHSNWDSAIAEYTEAIRLDSNLANPYRHHTFAYMQKGNFTQAHADVNRALQISPNYQDAQTLRLSVELRQRGSVSHNIINLKKN